jgi:proton-dependent oligopeptide transporter, POT family
MFMSQFAAIPKAPEATFGGHPRGLYVLFGAEMWERFSYYGMRSLLVLYLVNYLKWPRPVALDLYATYTGLVFLTPLLGGFMADRFLGQRKAILIGGIVIAVGHFVLAFEHLLYLGLGLVVLGTGYFKPNISTVVGQLYRPGDARRDAGYTIFYMGINLGAFLAPLVCGTLGENPRFGWHYGFAAAGVGMVFGLINFAVFQRALGSGSHAPGRGDDPRIRAVDWVQIVVLAAISCSLVYAAVGYAPTISAAVGPLGWLVVLGYWFALSLVLIVIAWISYWLFELRGATIDRVVSTDDASSGDAASVTEDVGPLLTPANMKRVAVILVVSVFSIVFWMAFEQAGGTLNLFADKKTDRVLLGNQFPASWFQSVNAFFIIALAPLFSILWSALDRTRFKLNSATKMGIGLIFVGLSFSVMFNADRLAGPTGKVGPLWLVSVYLLNTIGELCLSPIGLSLVSKLAPRQIASLMMAFWFLCTAAANYLAGKLESIVEGRFNLWVVLIITSVVPGLILLALNPLLKKMAQGRL